jgi:TonB-dependent receptor
MRTTGALRLTCLWFTGKGKQAPMNILRTDPTSRPALAAWTRAWRVVGCFVAAVLVASHAFAQSASGRLVGRIDEANTGRSLEGAIVRVEGTPLKGVTDEAGRYVINAIPAGTYRVSVDYVGYVPALFDVTIAAGQTATVDAGLSSLNFAVGVTVSGVVTGAGRAINQQRTAAGIVNIVSEEQFGAMVDGNIGQALQRLPGLSVDQSQDGSQGAINIRGIAGEFNSVQIDGNRVPSSGGDNAFNPRQVSADSVTVVEVIKAPTPDRDGDAIGGIVNLVSRTAFERRGRETDVMVGGTLNSLSGNAQPNVRLDYSDIFSVRGGERNLAASFSLSHYRTDRYSENADQDWIQVDAATNPQLNLGGSSGPVWFMESTHFEHDTRETDTTTLAGSIDFKVGKNNSFFVRPLFSALNVGGVKYETDIDIDTRFQNNAGGRKTYGALTPTYGRGTDRSQASRGWIGTLEDSENRLYSLALGGTNEFRTSTVKYGFSSSRNERTIHHDDELNMLMEPDDPWFVFEYEVVDPKGDVRVDVINGVDSTDLRQMTEGELQVVSGNKRDSALTGHFDWEQFFGGTRAAFKLKAGAKYRASSQKQDLNADVYEMDETFPYAQVLTPTNEVLFRKQKYFDVQPRAGLDLLASTPSLYELVEDDSLEDSNISDYDATERIGAAYVMGTWEFGINTIIGGVRFENYDWDNTNKVVSYLDEVPTVRPVNVGQSHSFVLPGIHGRHAITDKLILRESYNRSYGRPRLEELSRGRWVDDEGNIEDGNPNLLPAVSHNFDVQLEYYTQTNGLFSVGYFRKHIKDFTYTEVYNFDALDANNIPIPVAGGDFEYERPVNGTDATNQGIELIARQNLFFLPGALKGLWVGLSATFTESDANYPDRTDRDDLPLEGFSPRLYTATVDYQWKSIQARVDYYFRDDYIEGLGSDIESDEFFGQEQRLDAEVHYWLPGRKLRLSATATNLTNEPQVSYQGYPSFVEDASFSGRKFQFNVRWAIR